MRLIFMVSFYSIRIRDLAWGVFLLFIANKYFLRN
ncbi:Uncharacterised protein [Serratia fonticola]|nr:Uncharacterised protein [Serratia fonticola]CAI0698456.1 Uncharacterised protein [Serratia fonticola]